MKNREEWRQIVPEAKVHTELYRRGEGRKESYTYGRLNSVWESRSHGTDRTENVLPILRVLSLPGNNVFTELFPSNGCYSVACLHSCYLAMGVHVTIFSNLIIQ
jgi:hypothetical protein